MKHSEGKKAYKKKRRAFKRKNRVKTENTKEFNNVTTLCLPKGVDQMFPDRLCTKMKNFIQVQFTGVAGAYNGFCITGNSLHNSISNGIISGANGWTVGTATNIYGLPNLLSTPTTTSTGVYNQYRIISSRIRMRCQNTSGSANDCGTLVIVPVSNNAIAGLGNVNVASYLEFGELPYAKMKEISGSTMNNGVTIVSSMSTARQYALKYRASLEDSVFTGTWGANPGSQWFWCILWAPNTTGTTALQCICDIEYYIEFFDRNNLALGTG